MFRNIFQRTRVLPLIVYSISKTNYSRGRRYFTTDNVKKCFSYPPVKILTLLGFFWPLKSSPTEKPVTNTSENVSLENKLKEADQMFDNNQFSECCDYLKSIQKDDNVEILWRLSRVLYQMASAPGIDNKNKERLASEAFDIVTKAMSINENHFAVHKWMSVILDLKSSCEGIKQRIKNLEVVKKHMMRAVEINPSDATTLYMLGEWCYRIADMPWYQRKIAKTLFANPPTSSFEEALSYFSNAEVMEPNFYSMNLLMLGKCYLKLGKEDAAKHYLLLALSYPARTNDDHQANKEAQEILKTLK